MSSRLEEVQSRRDFKPGSYERLRELDTQKLGRDPRSQWIRSLAKQYSPRVAQNNTLQSLLDKILSSEPDENTQKLHNLLHQTAKEISADQPPNTAEGFLHEVDLAETELRSLKASETHAIEMLKEIEAKVIMDAIRDVTRRFNFGESTSSQSIYTK